MGHDAARFLQKHPQAAGRLVLQDQKQVIEDATQRAPLNGVEPMVHDFFTPQPVHGMLLNQAYPGLIKMELT